MDSASLSMRAKAEGLRPSAKELEALKKLRDHIAPEQEIGYWIIYNGDPEREYPQVDAQSPELESRIVADEPKMAGLGARKLKASKSSEAMRRLFGRKKP